MEKILGNDNPFGVILAVLVGVPMYADIFGTIPVAEALLSKGAQLGTILRFYDGCDNVKSAVYDHAAKSSQTKIAGSICNNLYDWNRDGGILV